MNISIRKLALLEEALNQKIEKNKNAGLVSIPEDLFLKDRVYALVGKIHKI